ncbi:MAG: type VI secretion system tube protein Hcp [Acidobacteriia bacterium]|nr:type VI secretion system tube protein Hcp [Terriglobia bacterium]
MSAQIGNIGPFDVNGVALSTQYAGGAAAPTATGATVSDIYIGKSPDSCSSALTMACAQGTLFDSATVTFLKDDGSSAPYLTYQLTSVVVAAFRSSGGDEQLDLSFSRISYSYNVSP